VVLTIRHRTDNSAPKRPARSSGLFLLSSGNH
jgi:hypothetical protein